MLSKYKGAMLGLAICDALGAPVEFKSPGSFTPITDYRSGGAFGLKAGCWTDDTSLALCLAESLIERKCFDPIDQLERYLMWYEHGRLSVTGSCFDIGNTTHYSLSMFKMKRIPYPGPVEPRTAGNGSLMRLAPVPLFFAKDPAIAIRMAADSSRTTHGNVEPVDACRYYSGLIIGALRGASKEEILSDHYMPVNGIWKKEPLTSTIDEIASGSFKTKMPPAIKSSGHVVMSMEAALWAFYHGNDFKEGALLAVNLGDDADTTGAIYGQLAGAYYGVDGIPDTWVKGLAKRELIEGMAEKLYGFNREN